MVSRVALLLALAVVTARAGIDFTPRAHFTELDGMRITETSFRSGDTLVLYTAPGGWTFQGSGPLLRLMPKASLSDASIESRPLGDHPSLDDAAVIALKKDLLATLPKEAEKIEWEPVEVNPLYLNKHETRRVEVSYSAFAQRFRITVIVCNFAEEQIRFRLGCRESDFEKLYDAFRRSLYTWHGMK